MNTIIKDLDLNEKSIKKLLDFYASVFKKTPLSYFEKRIKNDPFLQKGDIKIIEVNGKIISSITIFRRKLNKGNHKGVLIGGIANVGTKKEERGKGFSSLLLKNAINYIKEKNFSYSLLFTGINSFYEKIGFKNIKTKHAIVKIKKKRNLKWKIETFSEKYMTEIKKLYDFFNEKLPGTVIRDDSYWHANLKFKEDDEIFLIAVKNSNIGGYLRAVKESPKGIVWEFGFYDREAFEDLLLQLSNLLKKEIIPFACLLHSPVIPDSEIYSVEYRLSSLPMIFKIKEKEDEIEKQFNFWWTDNF